MSRRSAGQRTAPTVDYVAFWFWNQGIGGKDDILTRPWPSNFDFLPATFLPRETQLARQDSSTALAVLRAYRGKVTLKVNVDAPPYPTR